MYVEKNIFNKKKKEKKNLTTETQKKDNLYVFKKEIDCLYKCYKKILLVIWLLCYYDKRLCLGYL